MAKSPAQMEYMRAYKRMHSWIKYGIWRDDAKAQTLLCEQGGLSVNDLKILLGN